MFASQLLRILQTYPSNVKYESCVFDPAEQDMIMKENRNEPLCDTESFGSHADSLDFGNKETYHPNDSKRDINPLAYEVKGNEYWNPFLDDFPMDNGDGARVSLSKDDNETRLSFNVSTLEMDSIPLSSYAINEEKALGSSDHGPLGKIQELSNFDDMESRHSDSTFDPRLDLPEAETNWYSDKGVSEREVPELVVCYKEINYHIVKDICIDDGMPVKEKRPDEGSKDGHYHAVPPNEFVGGADMEFFAPDVFAFPPSSKDSELVYSTVHGNKEGSRGELISQGNPRVESESSFEDDNATERGNEGGSGEKLKSQGQPIISSGSSSDEDTAKDGDLEKSVQQTGETKHSTADISHTEEKASFVNRPLPIQEFGTRSFLRSFLDSLDDDRSNDEEIPDQISLDKPVLGNSSTGAGAKEDLQARSLLYNSKVESGSITFNFKSPAQTGRTENTREQPVVSGDMHDHENLSSNDHMEATQVESSSIEDKTEEHIHVKALSIKDGNIDASAASSCKNSSQENIPEKTPDLENEVSGEGSANEQVPPLISDSQISGNNDGQAVEPNDSKHEQSKDSVVDLPPNQYPTGGVSIANPLQRDEGETSFSAPSLITYSGPVAYSGSLSVRSDGSATSARSFAFPVLQTEWNSSPVRMAKADRKHFRKHKGWRSGLLCCRF